MPYKNTDRNYRQRGFTLLELMVVLAIAAIMAALAVPSFTRMIRSQRVLAASNALIAGFTVARSEAINRGADVSICPTNDPNAAPPACNLGTTNWENGWLIYVTTTGEAAGTIRVGESYSGVTIVAPGPGALSFDNRGILPGAPPPFLVNATDCTAGLDTQISVTINATGRVTSAKGVCP